MMGGRKRRDSLSVRIIIMGAAGRATPSTCGGLFGFLHLPGGPATSSESDKPELENALRNF
jgi:hypothetical protein